MTGEEKIKKAFEDYSRLIQKEQAKRFSETINSRYYTTEREGNLIKVYSEIIKH